MTLQGHKTTTGDKFQSRRPVTAGFSLNIFDHGPIRPGGLEADPIQGPPGAIDNTKEHRFVNHFPGIVYFLWDHHQFLISRKLRGREPDMPENCRILGGPVAARRNPIKAGWKVGKRIPALWVARRLVHEVFVLVG